MQEYTISTPKQLKELYPLSENAKNFIEKARTLSQNIVLGKEKKLALVIGPCSIHDFHSTIEYAKEFSKLSKRVEKKFFLVLRLFIEKSRTKLGWKGMVYDPYLDSSHEMNVGLSRARQLLIQLAEMNIACAMEFVDPLVAKYIDDLIVWGFVGARTTSSQLHRQYSSHLKIPVGFKNTLEGNVEMAICSMLSSQNPHSFLYVNNQGMLCQTVSQGNPYTHIVLRGSIHGPNCDALSIEQTLLKIKQHESKSKIMVDCSHGNSQKDPSRQIENFEVVLHQIYEGNDSIFGVMLESHLNFGSQQISDNLEFGVSITDSCLDWKTTKDIVLKWAEKLNLAFSCAL